MGQVLPLSPALFALTLLCAGTAAAQTTPAANTSAQAPATAGTPTPTTPGTINPHYDLNMYPALSGGTGTYDLNMAKTQSGPPGTIAMTSAAPPPAYSFKDMLANTHGYVEAGVSSRGGHEESAGVSIPLVPGKADLDLAAGTGQFAGYPTTAHGKNGMATYDTYSAGLHLHPTDDTDAYIGFTGLRMHGPAYSPFGYP